MPAYAASLSYFESFRSARLPSNLIQAQRDYFGAHTYELIGHEGVFHTQWTPVHEDAANKQSVQEDPEKKTEEPSFQISRPRPFINLFATSYA